jgi:uncharacterized protein YcfJ
MKLLKHKLIGGSLLVALGLGAAGCANNAQNGALIGGGAGALLGGVVGNNVRHGHGHHRHGHTAEGALIGAGVGAVGGYIIGNEMDKKEQRDRERYYDYDRRYDDRRYEPAPPPPPPVYEEYRYEERRYQR